MIYKSSHGTVYATGDIHGNFTGLVKFVAENLENCDVIVCGDIGIRIIIRLETGPYPIIAMPYLTV